MARAKRVKIVVKEWEHFGKAWARFERLVDAEGVLQDYRDHEHFEAASSKRKRRKSLAKIRERKRVAEENSGSWGSN